MEKNLKEQLLRGVSTEFSYYPPDLNDTDSGIGCPDKYVFYNMEVVLQELLVNLNRYGYADLKAEFYVCEDPDSFEQVIVYLFCNKTGRTRVVRDHKNYSFTGKLSVSSDKVAIEFDKTGMSTLFPDQSQFSGDELITEYHKVKSLMHKVLTHDFSQFFTQIGLLKSEA